MLVILILLISLFAWAPWITEDYARNGVTKYLIEKGRPQEKINFTEFEKVPFGIMGGLLVPSSALESATPETLKFFVTFYGDIILIDKLSQNQGNCFSYHNPHPAPCNYRIFENRLHRFQQGLFCFIPTAQMSENEPFYPVFFREFCNLLRG